MSQPFIAQIQAFPFPFAPKGWALCNGQTLPIAQNQALFSLLGTMYGGDGQVNFKLPNLQGACALSFGTGFTLGQAAGENAHTLTSTEVPAHSHPAVATSGAASVASPIGAFPATLAGAFFGGTPDAPVNLGSGSTSTSAAQPHENRPPFLVLNYCIALQGIFPSRN
jgi:microcystin-dependent protein